MYTAIGSLVGLSDGSTQWHEKVNSTVVLSSSQKIDGNIQYIQSWLHMTLAAQAKLSNDLCSSLANKLYKQTPNVDQSLLCSFLLYTSIWHNIFYCNDILGGTLTADTMTEIPDSEVLASTLGLWPLSPKGLFFHIASFMFVALPCAQMRELGMRYNAMSSREWGTVQLQSHHEFNVSV